MARATAASPADRYLTASLMRQDLTRREVMSGARREATRRSCLVCETPTLPGSPLCRAYPPGGRVAILLVRQPGPEFRRAVAEPPGGDLGLVDQGHLAEAEAGRRALIEVPLAAATGLAPSGRLTASGATDRHEPGDDVVGDSVELPRAGRGRAWAGLFAGVVASPLFFRPALVAGLLLVSDLKSPALPWRGRGRGDRRPDRPRADRRAPVVGAGPGELPSEVIRLARGPIERNRIRPRERRQRSWRRSPRRPRARPASSPEPT
ncbi:MAG: hypothetical protein R2909_10645 [Gemmatimonadales bacterium]